MKKLIILVCLIFMFSCASAPKTEGEKPVPTKSEVEEPYDPSPVIELWLFDLIRLIANP